MFSWPNSIAAPFCLTPKCEIDCIPAGCPIFTTSAPPSTKNVSLLELVLILKSTLFPPLLNNTWPPAAGFVVKAPFDPVIVKALVTLYVLKAKASPLTARVEVELTSIQAAYTMGAMTLSAAMSETDNVGGVSAAKYEENTLAVSFAF